MFGLQLRTDCLSQVVNVRELLDSEPEPPSWGGLVLPFYTPADEQDRTSCSSRGSSQGTWL